MKKNFKISFIITLIIIIVSNISYAININNENNNENQIYENDFFITNNTKISKGELLEMTIDISKIEYDKFRFTLKSNLENNEIYTNNEIEIENKEEETNNDLNFEIDKNKMNFDKITLCYNISQNAIVGEKIELLAQILIEDDESQEKEYKMIQEKKIEVEIIENEDNDKKEENNQQNENKNLDINDKKSSELSNNLENLKLSNLKNNTITETENVKQNTVSLININTNNETENTSTYNGSSNNYLSNIIITGVSLNTTFNKENTNYFVTVESKENLEISVTKEDSSAKVQIMGNNELKNGKNKILISVTAENGDVRYYRIFITNN